mgnify:CR=1 FL=1
MARRRLESKGRAGPGRRLEEPVHGAARVYLRERRVHEREKSGEGGEENREEDREEERRTWRPVWRLEKLGHEQGIEGGWWLARH